MAEKEEQPAQSGSAPEEPENENVWAELDKLDLK